MKHYFKRQESSLQTHIPPLLITALLFISFESLSAPLSKIDRHKKKSSQNEKIEIVKDEFKVQKVKLKQSSVAKFEPEENKSEIANIRKSNDTANVVRDFLKSSNLGVSDSTSTFDILTATTLKGQILTSIKSSSLGSPIKVQIYPGQYLKNGGILNCKGIPETASIKIICNQLIADNEEYLVETEILNLDGTAGIRGEVYTGKEEGFIGSLLGAYLRGSLDVEQERVAIPTGEMIKNTSRNKVLGGTIGATDEGIEILQNEMKGKQPKIAIEAGTQIYIYFLSRFKQ